MTDPAPATPAEKREIRADGPAVGDATEGPYKTARRLLTAPPGTVIDLDLLDGTRQVAALTSTWLWMLGAVFGLGTVICLAAVVAWVCASVWGALF